MTGELIIGTLVSGIILGSMYSLFALSLTLIYGVTKVFHFALGSVLMSCCYYMWFALNYFHANYWEGFAIGILGAILLGIAYEKLIMHPIRKRRGEREDWQFYSMVAALGLGIFLDNLNHVCFNPKTKALPLMIKGSIMIRNTFLMSKQDGLNLVIAVLVLVFVGVFLKKTRTGIAVRAVSQHIEGAKCVGIYTDRVFLYVSMISALIAGIAGVLLSSRRYITPLGGWDALIKGFVIIALGGLGSCQGALYSAFILGLVEAFVTLLFGNFWTMFFWFMVLTLILLLKPEGLLGRF